MRAHLFILFTARSAGLILEVINLLLKDRLFLISLRNTRAEDLLLFNNLK
jgi:hypothetical protein